MSRSLRRDADRAFGTLVVYAYMGGGSVVINPFDLIVKRIVVKGFFLNHPDIEPKIHAALRETVPLVASGAIQVPIAATYPLSSLREAILHAQRGGKVLLDLRGTTSAEVARVTDNRQDLRFRERLRWRVAGLYGPRDRIGGDFGDDDQLHADADGWLHVSRSTLIASLAEFRFAPVVLQKSPWEEMRNNRIGASGFLNLEGSVRSRGTTAPGTPA